MKAALLLLLLAPVPVGAQGLGDAAARERQKREEKKAPPAKVFTDRDLSANPKDAGSPGPEGSAEAPSSQAAPSASGEPADPLEKERQQRKLLEAEWRVRFANAREELATAEANSSAKAFRDSADAKRTSTSSAIVDTRFPAFSARPQRTARSRIARAARCTR